MRTSKAVDRLAATAGVAVAYFVAGKLAGLLAISPGYATALWPAAGIAIAGVLLFGYRAWPGVFLGAFLVDLSTSFEPTTFATILQSVALPTAIACGATLQALLGAFLIRAFVGFPSDFDRLGRILGAMVLGGPVACLTSATIGVAGLLLTGRIEAADLARTWGTWWLGDSIGALLLIPLASAWRLELRRASRRTRSAVWVLVLGAVAMTVAGYLAARSGERGKAQAEFERRAESMARTLELTVLAELEIVQSIVSLFEASVDVTRSEFRIFVEPAFAHHQDLQGLSWNALVSGDRRAAFEEAVRQGEYSGFRITERDAAGRLVPVRDRDQHVVVFFIEPYAGNEQALGFDLASDSVRARVLAQARDTGQTLATPPILLVQETEQKPGVLLFSPVYKTGLPHDTPDRRRRNLHSFVSGVFSTERLIEGALEVFRDEGIDIEVADVSDPEDVEVFYRARRPNAERADPAHSLAWSTDLEVAGRVWRLRFWPSSKYLAALQGLAGFILTGGLLFSSLLGAFLLAVAGRTSAAERSTERLRLEVRERQHAEAALIASEGQFRAIFENAAVGVGIVEADRYIKSSNEALQRFLGYSGEELAAMKFSDLTHPEDVDASVRRFTDLVAGLRSYYEEEKRWLTKRGETVWGHIAVSLVRNTEGKPLFAVGMVQAITKQKQREQALLQTQFSVDRAVDGIFWVEQDGSLSFVNEAACTMTRHSREKLLAGTLFDIDPSHSRETWPEFWQTVRRADKLLSESLLLRSDGSTFPAELAINYLEVAGVGRCFVSARDTTARKRAEEERLLLEAKLLEAQRLESLGVLAGGIAHDFNNLLVGVLGNAHLALAKLTSAAPLRAPLQAIETAAQRAADLANQLLAYSGKGKFVVEPIDLSELIHEVSDLVEASVSKKASIEYHLEEELPTVEADSTQLQQVVFNLITNASDAVDEHGGVVSVGTGRVECDADYLSSFGAPDLPPGIYVFVDVTDNGSGMDEATRKRMFDPFFTTKFTGRGLGLAAVLGIVRGHGGGIRVISQTGEGTTIKVLLPASKRSPRATVSRTTSESTWEGEGTVLLVDDEETVRQFLRTVLSAMGFEVLVAVDGVEALRIYREHAADVVLVLLDMTMPRMDGVETFKELRGVRQDVKVILTSGYSERDTASRFAGVGPVGFIQKPFRPDALRNMIRAALDA